VPHEFEIREEVTVDATPEQVWEAIATGPGIDAWFMGRNEVEPREGGTVRMTLGPYAEEATVTAWEPPRRFAYRGGEGEDGSFMAFEYLIEGRQGGGTVVRLVQSGVLGGDDWEAEYDALRKGWPMYLRTLAQYLAHFPGRTATPVSAQGPMQADQDRVWEALKRGLGLTGTVTEGDQARFTLDGTEHQGVVDAVHHASSADEPTFLGVRTADGLYRFLGRGGTVGVGHHIFAEVDQQQAERSWQAWLARLFA
jgi:uncharacterized protein YndB with AHSA1/START domain